jgi:hypothetical protein
MTSPPPDRRHVGRRQGDDLHDDALDPAILLGYEQWAGQVWRHRGKLAAIIGMTGSLAGCVVGYLGRSHDLDGVKTHVTVDSARIAKVEEFQAAQERTEAVKMQMLCSLTRRIDPLGVPVECGAIQKK